MRSWPTSRRRSTRTANRYVHPSPSHLISSHPFPSLPTLFSHPLQTKELATRYERSLQESELLTEKSKARFDVSIEELERILLQKEGESPKDNIQGRSPGGKRAIGKAAAKGALLLKGKNPGNVRLFPFFLTFYYLLLVHRVAR